MSWALLLDHRALEVGDDDGRHVAPPSLSNKPYMRLDAGALQMGAMDSDGVGEAF